MNFFSVMLPTRVRGNLVHRAYGFDLNIREFFNGENENTKRSIKQCSPSDVNYIRLHSICLRNKSITNPAMDAISRGILFLLPTSMVKVPGYRSRSLVSNPGATRFSEKQ
jgi:hypothetical protein